MDRARLVYTTDKKLAEHNVEIFDESVGREARGEMSSIIDQMHKTKKRSCIMGKGFRDMEKKYREISKIVDILEIRATTHNNIYTKFYDNAPKDKYKDKYLQNLLQTIKYASHQVICSKNNFWQIDPKYMSGKQALIEAIKQNYSTRWRVSRINKTKAVEGKEMAVKGTGKIKRRTPSTAAGGQVVSNQQVINVSNISSPIDVPIVISITVRVNVEYSK